MELRTIQKLFLEKAEQTRKEGNKKGLLILATGLGKSLGALSDALKVTKKDEKILVLAHNQDLLKQLSTDFKKLNKTRKIGFMYKVKKDISANVIFGNVRTIKNYLESFKKDEFAYIIVDESHHTSAKTYKTILEYFTPRFLLGMTATPTRNDEKDILPLYDNNIILNIGEKEAMDKKWLRPYKMVAFWDRWCDYGDIKHYQNHEGLYRYDIKEVGKKYIVPERIKGIFDIIKNGKEGMKFKGIGDKKGVYFSVRCVVAKRYCDEFNKLGIKSVYIDGKTSPVQRVKILKDFAKGKYQLLFNVGLIGEGFHIPKVDLVIIDRPTDSHILWNQQKGRQIFNIEGQEDNSEGLLIDFVGNSKGNFKKYTYNSERKDYSNEKEFIQLVENSIGVPCEFEGEVIKEIRENYHNIYFESGRTLKMAIIEFKKIYNGKKIGRQKLYKENRWISSHFYLNNLLDKYCFKTKKRLTLEETILEFKRLYGDKKIKSGKLVKEHSSIYKMFYDYKLLDKYCIRLIRLNGNEKIKKYHQIYKKKPKRTELSQNYPAIYRYFQKNNLLDKYCLRNTHLNLNESIKKYHQTYKEKPTRYKLQKESSAIYNHFQKNNLLDKYCLKSRTTKIIIDKKLKKELCNIYKKGLNLKDIVKDYKIGDKRLRNILVSEGMEIRQCKPRYNINNLKRYKEKYKGRKVQRSILLKKDRVAYLFFKRAGLLERYCYQTGKRINHNNNIKITSNYKPITIIPHKKLERKQTDNPKSYPETLVKHEYKTTEEKIDIREKIISKIQDNDLVLLLESPELSALKEIEKQNKKPRKIIIPNHLEFKKIAEALKNYKTDLKIELINTSALQYLVDSKEKFDFIWLDYCGAFSYYMKDLDVLFAKHLDKMKLILTYNLFDPAKSDDSYYFTRVIDYVLGKTEDKKVRLINDITFRYKKQMYNLGFEINNLETK